MKTKEFIKMLKEADPSGECHIRLGKGVPWFAERKEGYWDGPYEYIEDNKFVISTRHDKVDIHIRDSDDWIWEHDGDYSTIKLDFYGYAGTILEKMEERYIKGFEEVSKECKRTKQQLTEHSFFRVYKKLKDGWKIRESKGRDDYWLKHMMVLVKDKKEEKMNAGDCTMVHKCDLLESYDEDSKFRFWRLK